MKTIHANIAGRTFPSGLSKGNEAVKLAQLHGVGARAIRQPGFCGGAILEVWGASDRVDAWVRAATFYRLLGR